ncbi:MAG: hypothetical protein NTZ25_03135 [Candidatus Peregrinibacteria bacterium]|nr:hypothetical protein [Candidatus Peregrinibacteria bacterium]
MAREEQKQTAPQEKPKEGKFKLENIPGAFSKALENVGKSKDKHWYEKIAIFAKTFWNEIRGIEDEKKEVSAEAKAEANKSIDARVNDAKAAAKLDEKTPEADKEFFNEAVAMVATAGGEVPVEMQDALKSAKGKLTDSVNNKTPEMSTLDEVKAMGSLSLLTIAKFKAKYNDPTKFKEALDRLYKISDKSAFKLEKLLSMPVLKIFKTEINSTVEGIQAGLSFIPGSGIEKGQGLKLLESFNLTTDDVDTLKGIKEQPMKNESEIAAVMKKSIFPNTNEAKIKNVMKITNKLMVEKPDHIDTQTLTDLVFNIEDSDIKRLIEILTGKKSA